MAKLTNSELQEKLDIQKWKDSEEKGADTCGEYAYCANCDKTQETPCAVAYNKTNKPAKKTVSKKK
jgi:hypothetical protein